LQQLRAHLAAIEPTEVHLVASATAGRESLELTTQSFAAAGATRLVLTKLDEAGSGAAIAECLAAGYLPLSYTTHGQNVPHDIRPAAALDLAAAIVPTLLPAGK
jgi:flagellar biosynthesis protein FlhF